MAGNYEKERLADYVDEYVYRPILSRTPDDFEPSYRAMLMEVQHTVRERLGRLQAAGSAAEVVASFKASISAANDDDLHRKMKELGLPLPEKAWEGFEDLALTLGVTAPKPA